MTRIGHYFTAFQTHVIGQAEITMSRFSMEQALLILEREAKYKEVVDKMKEEEKNSPAVKMSKEEMERDLDTASRKKSQQLESAITKAISGAMGSAGAPGAAAAVPGAGAPTPAAPRGRPPLR